MIDRVYRFRIHRLENILARYQVGAYCGYADIKTLQYVDKLKNKLKILEEKYNARYRF